VQGSYLQAWLLLSTDWNWRLEPQFSGEILAVADIGSHWLDLTTFITGLQIEAVCADFATFPKTHQKPTQPVETFTGKLQTNLEYVEQPINTEDYATVMLCYTNSAP
jgi:predicted dehydrogenase